MSTNLTSTSEKIDDKQVAFFNFKKLGDKYLLTNDMGAHIFLKDAEFSDYLRGRIQRSLPAKYEELKSKGFIRAYLDFESLIKQVSQKNSFLFFGPSLHIIVVTLRCDQTCVYCQAGSGNSSDTRLDMRLDIATRVVDRIFESPNPSVTIEFQGGEPLLNFDAIKTIVNYAIEKNKMARKKLFLALVTNLSKMDKDKFAFLINNNVSVCTSLDGPLFLHRMNRRSRSDKKNYMNTKKWISQLFSAYKKGHYPFRPQALLTVTRNSLKFHKEIIDSYLSFGFNAIHLRSLSPLGFAKSIWKKIGYTSDEFIDFYKKALDYILWLNKRGSCFYERSALIFLKKILSLKDSNYLDLRSPCGAVCGQLAYNFDGDIYVCDEARMLARMGDESFKIGNLEMPFGDLVNNRTVQSLGAASILENLPGCSSCVYSPYCGVCPILNYVDSGNIFGKAPYNFKCRINSAQLDYIFEKIEDKNALTIFQKWLPNS